jgi:hypothetical protein
MGVETKNKYAVLFHEFRIIPRALTIGYAWMVWDVVQWFKTLETPNTQQALLLTTVVGISAAVFGLYTSSTSGSVK